MFNQWAYLRIIMQIRFPCLRMTSSAAEFFVIVYPNIALNKGEMLNKEQNDERNATQLAMTQELQFVP
jgi:hypothetical protein